MGLRQRKSGDSGRTFVQLLAAAVLLLHTCGTTKLVVAQDDLVELNGAPSGGLSTRWLSAM